MQTPCTIDTYGLGNGIATAAIFIGIALVISCYFIAHGLAARGK